MKEGSQTFFFFLAFFYYYIPVFPCDIYYSLYKIDTALSLYQRFFFSRQNQQVENVSFDKRDRLGS